MGIGGTLICLLCFVCCSGSNISTTTTSIPGCDPQCHNEACDVCRDNGTGTVPLEALKATFNTGSPIDLILMVDTSVHKQFDDVKVFIASMMKQLSLSFNFMIHPDQVRVAVLKINSIGTTVWFDGISSREKAITFCQINDVISSLQVDTNSTNKKLFNGLTFYNQEFLRKTPTRPDASKVLWIFSDANGVEQTSLNDVVTSGQDIKQGSVSFTTAFDRCPWGWFNNRAKETAMRNIASNASYYACYEMWLKVKTLMILGKPYKTSNLVEVNNGSSLCSCDVSTGYYKCDKITIIDHTVAMAAGTAGGIAGVIVAMIVIIVVAVKCRKKRNTPPLNPQNIPDNRGPRLPRVSTINTDIERLPGEGADAPPMPLPPKARNRTRVEGGNNARTNEPAQYMNAQNAQPLEPGAQPPVPQPQPNNDGYQIPRNSGEQQNMMDAWSEYLTASAKYYKLSHLAVHSTSNNNNPEWFARTRDFKMVAGELALIERTMIEGSTGGNVLAAGQLYRVESATAVQLQGIRTVTRGLSFKQVHKMLCVVKNEHYIVIGICPRNNDNYFSCLQAILDQASLV